MNPNLSSAVVIGAGTMGHSLALMFALGGKSVHLTDVDSSRLETAGSLILSELGTLKEADEFNGDPAVVMGRISTSIDFREAVANCDLVVEAIVEDVAAKKSLFLELASCIGPQTIVSSNTSYLNVFPLAPEAIQKRFLITHFFSPPHIVPLVEIVGSPLTDSEVVSRVHGWLKEINMSPVILRKFLPGFIVNRLQRAIGREILYMIDEGFASPQEIDRAVKSSLALRMPIVGVVRRIDFAGVDMALRAQKAPSIGLVSEDRISPTVAALVEQGRFGVKTGRGFYEYSGTQEETLKNRDLKLLQIRKVMKELDAFEP